MRFPQIPGISVELFANGQALPEYIDEETTDGKHGRVTRYVEAVPNTEFSIHLTTDSKFRYRLDDFVVGIRIDGQDVTNYCISPKLYPEKHRQSFSSFVTNAGGIGQRRVFTFGELKTMDESLEKSEGPKLKAMLSKLGQVTVWLKRCKITGRRAPEDHRPFAPAKIGDVVPEKALKGRSISSRAAVREAGLCAPQASSVVEYPYGKESFAKFTFKYRSHRDLQIEGIIPRTPSPAPLDELDLDTMTREQAIEALRQQRESQQASSSVRVKRERAPTMVIYDDGSDDEEGDEGGVSITSVGPVKKRQRTSADSGIDLIDLTDD